MTVIQAAILTHAHAERGLCARLNDVMATADPNHPKVPEKRLRAQLHQLRQSGHHLSGLGKAIATIVKVREQVKLDAYPYHVRVTGAVAGRKMLTTPAPDGGAVH